MQKLLVTAILNTDVAQHNGLLGQVQSLVPCESPQQQFEECERLAISSFLLHRADISNAAKPFYTAERWTDLIMKEFIEQGEAEKRAGVKVSLSCYIQAAMVPDLQVISDLEIARWLLFTQTAHAACSFVQIQFINLTIIPPFSLLEKLLPASSVAAKHARQNILHWEEKKENNKTQIKPCTRSAFNHNEIAPSGDCNFVLGAHWAIMMKTLHWWWWLYALASAAALEFASTGKLIFQKLNTSMAALLSNVIIGLVGSMAIQLWIT